MVKRTIRRLIERALHRYGYRLVNPAYRYGIDVVADVTRLAKAWDVEVGLIADVGANLGATAMRYRSAWPDARIIAFEPDAAMARRLREVVGPAETISVRQIALSDRGGTARFYVYGDAPDLNSLNPRSPFVARFGVVGQAVDVAVTTLDAFCAQESVARIGLLKVDTEGSDYKVILGAERLLTERRIDFVYCEFNALDDKLDRLGSLTPIAMFLGARGYHFIASYNDYITTDGEFFAVSNALFAADRGAVAA